MPTTSARATQTLRWLEGKAPGDALPYYFDLTAWLGVDTITSATVGVAPNGAGDMVAEGAPGLSGSIIAVELSGGNPGTDYAVTVTVLTASGNTLVRAIWLACQYLSPEGALTPISTTAAIPAVASPVVLVNGALSLDGPALLAFVLAELAKLPPSNTGLPVGEWYLDSGIPCQVQP